MRRGSVFLNNRYHDPTLGVFISVDPLIAATGEPYIYASGNPTTYSDPTGLCTYVSGTCYFGGGVQVDVGGTGSAASEGAGPNEVEVSPEESAEVEVRGPLRDRLPRSGDFAFALPKKQSWNSLRSKSGTFTDADGLQWSWDKLHQDHWDVTNPRTGEHWNVFPDGRVRGRGASDAFDLLPQLPGTTGGDDGAPELDFELPGYDLFPQMPGTTGGDDEAPELDFELPGYDLFPQMPGTTGGDDGAPLLWPPTLVFG